jgi:hypothetical protein
MLQPQLTYEQGFMSMNDVWAEPIQSLENFEARIEQKSLANPQWIVN